MGIHNFPSNFVYWEKVEDHEDIKKMFLDQIKSIGNNTKDNKQGIVNGSTSYGIEDCIRIFVHPYITYPLFSVFYWKSSM